MTAQPFARRIITQIGYDRTAEIHCLIAIVENDFRRIGIEQSSLPVGLRKRFYESGYLRRRVIETVHNILYLSGLNKRLVPLHIDNDLFVATDSFIGFPTTVCTRAMIFRGHHDTPAKPLYRFINTGIVGRHINGIDTCRHLLINPLNHRLSPHIDKRFSGETGRCITGRNNSYKFHFSSTFTDTT